MSRENITKQFLHDQFSYAPLDISRPLVRRFDSAKIKKGEPAGFYCKHRGRFIIGITFESVFITFYLHRLVWLYKSRTCYKGSEIPKLLDHINRNPKDNRFENLRASTPSRNTVNSNLDPEKRKSRFRGVKEHKRRSGLKWRAAYQSKSLGYFDYTEAGEIQAALVYDRAVYKDIGPDSIPILNFPENKTNFTGQDSREYLQLEFAFLNEGSRQQVLDLSDVQFLA